MNTNALREAVGVVGMLHPGYHGKDLIRIRCFNDFEGHGRASETWEEHWEIELPQHQYFWLTNKKVWRMGKPGITQKFHARTLDECLTRAYAFLSEVGEESKEYARKHAESALQNQRS